MPKAKAKTKHLSEVSPHHYTYPGSNVLKNKYGIEDLKGFLEKCSHDSAKEMVNLRREPPPQNFDSGYLKYLHYRLFQHTFEWAGHTRDETFTFEDGTSATMPEMKRTGWDHPFAIGDEIKEGLKTFDQKLSEKNNLQGLTREDFVVEAVGLFTSLNQTHPFREGNGRAQRIFFEKLAETAGHRLDFSLVTKERMMLSSIAAAEDGNLEPMQHLFDDISHPERASLLKEFMDNMKENGRNVNDRPVQVAQEGQTYTGTYRGCGAHSFAFNVKGFFIIGNKDHLPLEQLETLKPGDKFTFTVPTTQELEKTLIPKETLAPLTKSELSAMVSEDACVSTCREQIQRLTKTVYGSSKTLNSQMEEMNKNPELGQRLANQIERSPSSVSRLAGFDFICLKNRARAEAEEHVEMLCTAVANYAQAVKYAKKEITQEYQREQNRREKAVEIPSKNLQDLLSLPPDQQREALSHSPMLQQELRTFVGKLHDRLSSNEHKAIKNNDHVTLAKSIGVSENKAKEITETVQKVKEAHQQAQTIKAHRSQTLAIAS